MHVLVLAVLGLAQLFLNFKNYDGLDANVQ